MYKQQPLRLYSGREDLTYNGNKRMSRDKHKKKCIQALQGK